jgi:hypothetical protein
MVTVGEMTVEVVWYFIPELSRFTNAYTYAVCARTM